ncbi:Serine/threonine-protein kinase 17A-like [Aix galericulata]|nr:Serine/threonine-protein kinase 17A-like [Aix galericulata]
MAAASPHIIGLHAVYETPREIVLVLECRRAPATSCPQSRAWPPRTASRGFAPGSSPGPCPRWWLCRPLTTWLRSQCCRRGALPAVRGRGGRSLHREGRRAPAAADPERCGLSAPPRRRAPRPQGTGPGLGAAGRGWGGSRTTLMPSPAHQPQNILLTRSSPPGDIRIVDFGLSRQVDAVQEVREILGTPEYVAPEVLSYEPISTATDMWSVGVLTYVMLTGESPFLGDSKQETFLNIAQVNVRYPDELFQGISPLAVDFLHSLLVRDPSERAQAQQCLQHPWLAPGPDAAIGLAASEPVEEDAEPLDGPEGDEELVLVASCTLRCPCPQPGEAEPGGKPVLAPREVAREVLS